jgi:DNA-binding MarR family transcriptional regulator
MALSKTIPIETGEEVRDRCLCFHTQRAARTLARRFDNAFLPFGITNQQFSMMMMLNNAGNPRVGEVADFLAMDRTTLTAALKALERRSFVTIVRDEDDRRSKRISLTAAGGKTLKSALPVWRSEHAKIESEMRGADPNALRSMLRAVA